MKYYNSNSNSYRVIACLILTIANLSMKVIFEYVWCFTSLTAFNEWESCTQQFQAESYAIKQVQDVLLTCNYMAMDKYP
jgi:hypothetical protein